MSHLTKAFIFLVFILTSSFAMAAIWTAGSSYKGKVITPIKGNADVIWQCDGKKCQIEGDWGDGLAMSSCHGLVKNVGKITYYTNNAGKLWSPVSNREMLRKCNQEAK